MCVYVWRGIAVPTDSAVIDWEYRAGRKASKGAVVEGKMGVPGVPQEETGCRSLRDENAVEMRRRFRLMRRWLHLPGTGPYSTVLSQPLGARCSPQ